MKRLNLAVAIAGMSSSTAMLAADLHNEALRHGYKPTRPPADPSGTDVYVKIIKPRRTVAVLSITATSAQAQSGHSVVTYQINGHSGAVKYRSVESLDAQWHPKVNGLPLPKTGWHKPGAGSAAEQAVRTGCGAG